MAYTEKGPMTEISPHLKSMFLHCLPFMIIIGFEKMAKKLLSCVPERKVFGITCLVWFYVLTASAFLSS